MAFQRSYSKVWWGSDNQLSSLTSGMNTGSSFTSGGYYYTTYQQQANGGAGGAQNSHYHQQPYTQQHYQPFSGSGYHSLDYNSLRTFSGNLSRIQEVDDEQVNMSKLSWEKHDSPGSLRSQDSGFSDNEESHSTRSLGEHSSKTASPSTKSDVSRKSTNSTESPSTASTHTIATPPTVVRRVGRSEFYSPLVNVSRRISFSGSPTTLSKLSTSGKNDEMEFDAMKEHSIDGATLLEQLDSFQLLNSTPKQCDDINDGDNIKAGATNDYEALTVKFHSKPKRRRRIVRTATKPLTLPMKRRTMPKNSIDDSDDDNDDYDDVQHHNNEGDELKLVKHEHDKESEHNSSFDELESEEAQLRPQKRPVPAYHNETIYLGANDLTHKPYNNETVILGGVPEDALNDTLKKEDTTLMTSFQMQQRTSTPKTEKQFQYKSQKHEQQPSTTQTEITHNLPNKRNYTNPLLNGHPPALKHWLYELRSTYDHEVMSTLQTKSIAQEAFKNLTITTNTVAKLIRQLQQRAIYMQSDFERMERILTCKEPSSLHIALSSAEQLVANISEFTSVLERRSVFFSNSRAERRRYEENLDQIKMIKKDTRYSLERQHYINLESLLDDLQVLKRYLLIALRQVFERMVGIIVQSIEYGRCDLMLRANINMIATLTNIDYDGFASLTDAFVQNEAVRTLLIVCLEHKLSSVRALALRALATICCAPAAISQLSGCDGIEILRDILQVQTTDAESRRNGRGSNFKRSTIERREAVSLLAQLTAAWHGPEHRVEGLKDCVETIVAGLSQLVVDETSCAQTLLLCAAALNNLSRIEVTSHYSIMSNETVFKLIETVEKKQQQQYDEEAGKENGISIFLYEQIVSMLYNMSLNKKCHSHLANGCIINFITSAYEMEFYKRYDSRAESDAQHRTIKAILHTLTRLVHDSNGGSLGLELLQQQLQHQGIPAVLFKLANTSSHYYGMGNSSHNNTSSSSDQNVSCHQLSRDIELLVRQLELAQKQAQQRGCYGTQADVNEVNAVVGEERYIDDFEIGTKAEGSKRSNSTGLKFNLTKQESFV